LTRPLVDVRLEALCAQGGAPPPLADVSLHVRYGELFTLLGPPHSGKTSVLRAVAGFLPPSRGRVLIDGADVAALAPRDRGVGYVFHQGALWPHLTVGEHVAFGLEQLGIAREEIERRVEVVTTRLGLAAERDRLPAALGLEGQRRLALARALAVEPRVLLLDEPLAHLDPLSRKTLRLELARLHRDLAVTTICATRDAADAMALSDRIAVVADGRLLQVGEPETLYRRPASRIVAEAFGPANFLAVRVVEVRDLGVVVETRRGDRVPVAGIGAFREGSAGVLVLRPETLSITEAATARGPGIPGRVSLRVFEGARYVYEIDVGAGDSIRVELAASETSVFRLADPVRVELSSETVVLLPAEGAPHTL
jgi:ABC-type Fe3+/spermidine/putrescine transport system ATPase subunit